MTEQELFTLLSSEFNVAYDHFDKKVEPPFVIYAFDRLDTFKADDLNYLKENRYIIYLITDKKDTTLEAKMETLLDTNGILYDKDEYFISNERMYQIEYSI